MQRLISQHFTTLSDLSRTFSECGSLLLQLGSRYEHSDDESYKSCCTDVCLALHARPGPNILVSGFGLDCFQTNQLSQSLFENLMRNPNSS